MPLTSTDITDLQNILNSGNRGGFYLQYYNLLTTLDPTGDGARQVLIQAQITTYTAISYPSW